MKAIQQLGVTGNIRKINNKTLLKIAKNTIFGETTVTMETILCSRILQIFSTKYLIYTRECLKLIDEVIKFINWVVPGKIHTPPPTEEIFAVRRGREEKCLRMSERGRGKMS